MTRSKTEKISVREANTEEYEYILGKQPINLKQLCN